MSDALTTLHLGMTTEVVGLTTPRLRRTPPTEGNGTAPRIPSLRFPEFGGEWEKTHIGKVLTIGSGKDYKHLLSGDVPVYGTGGYMLSVNDFLYDGESVCIGRKGTIDKPVFVTGKFWTVDTLFYTHSFENVLPKFIYACFQRVNWKLYNEASGVPSLSKTTIEGIGLNIPSLPEQTKIAAFLSAVDSKIDQLTKKKALLEQYKKGVMQQLFSQHIRFKADDGRDYPEWEEKKFGDVVSLSSSKHNSEKNKSVQKCIELEHIDQVTGRLLGFVEGNDFGSIKNKFNKNNVLFGKLRPYLRKYIKAPFDGVCSSEIWVLDGKLVSNNYLYYLVQLEKFIELADQSIGSKMPRADWSHVSSGIFSIPSLPEQTKIANFLTAIDCKIEQVAQQLEAAKQFKKGLLQQMFV